MKKLYFIAVAACVAGCVVTPKFEDSALKQVQASISREEGVVKFATVAIWLPNSREFVFREVQPSVKGVVVITEKSFLFQQWGGPTGLTTVKRYSIAEIQDASLITLGRSGRLVIRTGGETYDSFAASDGAGEISVRAETTEMYNILAAMLAAK